MCVAMDEIRHPRSFKVNSPLATVMEKVYAAAGRRSRLAVPKICLSSLTCGTEQKKSFIACSSSLERQMLLVHVD